METQDLNNELVEGFARLAYAIIMMDGVVDEAERKIISTKFSGTPIMLPLATMMERKPQVMITEAYQNLSNQLKDINNSESCRKLMDALEQLAEAGEVLDEDDSEILKSILSSLKRRIS